MAINNSILNTVKDAIPGTDDSLSEQANVFDDQLIMYINAQLNRLRQLGVGPKEGFKITGPYETWDAFLTNDVEIDMAKEFIVNKVRLLFDTPQSGFVVTMLEKENDKLEWLMNVDAENDWGI